MATHAHSTRTPLSRPSGSPQRLLATGLGRQLGPVTVALADMRAADPDLDRQRLHELRRRIADRIEADIALLDALDGDTDREETALERAGRGFAWSGPDDAEDGHDAEGNTDDNGIADYDAIGEQGFRGYRGCL
ncbi:hypothetical protein ACRBEV_06275 [Methylobacterium phyllosphaerae]